MGPPDVRQAHPPRHPARPAHRHAGLHWDSRRRRGPALPDHLPASLALAGGGRLGYLPPEHYDQVFSAHGTIMIFFVAMPFVIGLMNIIVPLQIGARDVAFPVLNSISFWLTAAGALLPNIALGVGEF